MPKQQHPSTSKLPRSATWLAPKPVSADFPRPRPRSRGQQEVEDVKAVEAAKRRGTGYRDSQRRPDRYGNVLLSRPAADQK